MRVCRVSVYERRAGGRRAAGMAEKRRGSPCSMLSLKAHAFSVEALIGAEKQQQLQKKRRKLDTEEAAGAVDDGGCSRGGEKGSPEGEEGAALPPPVGAASGPARSCADLELSCGSRGAAGESPPSRPTSSRRVPSRVPRACTAAENMNFRELWACASAVSLRARGNSAPERIGYRSQGVKVAAALVALAAQLVPLSRRLKFRFQPRLPGCRRRVGDPRSTLPLFSAFGRADRSVLSASASLGVPAVGCSVFFPSF